MSNVIDFMMDGARQDRQQAQTGGMQEAFDKEADPEKAGEAINLSEATGVPPSTIHDNLDDFKANYNAHLMSQIIKNNPHLQDYANSHPLATKVSANDWANLDELSEKLTKLPKGKAVDKEWWESVGGVASHWFPSLWESGKDVVKSAGDMFKDAGQYTYPTRELDTVTQDMYKNGINAHNLGQYLGLLSQAVILAPMAGKDEKGEVRVKKDVTDAVNTAFGAIGTVFGITPTVRTLSEALDEVSGVPAEFTEQAAYFGMLFLGLKGVGKSHSRGGEIPPPGMDKEVDAIREHRSKEDLKAFNEATAAAQKSETTQIAPSLAEKFVGQHVKGQSVQVNVDAIRQLYGDKPPTPDDGILGWVPGLAKQIESQSLVGGDVRIPMELWQTRVDPEIAKVLKDDMKVTDDGISVNEAKELKENQEKLKPPPDTQLVQGPDINDLESRYQKVLASIGDSLEPNAKRIRGKLDKIRSDLDDAKSAMEGENKFPEVARERMEAVEQELEAIEGKKPPNTQLVDMSRRGFLKGAGATATAAATGKVPKLGEVNPFEAATPAIEEVFRKNVEYAATEYYEWSDSLEKYGGDFAPGRTALSETLRNMREDLEFMKKELPEGINVPSEGKNAGFKFSPKQLEHAIKLLESGWKPSEEALNKIREQLEQENIAEWDRQAKSLEQEGKYEEAQNMRRVSREYMEEPHLLPEPEEYMKAGYPKGLTEPGPRNSLRQHDEALASVRQGARLTHLVDTDPIKLELVSKSKDMSVSGDGEVVHSFDVKRGDEKVGGFQAIPREGGKLIYIDWAGAAKTHAPWQEGTNTLPILYQTGRELRKVFPDAERIGGLRGDKYVEYRFDDLGPATLAMGERPKGWDYVEGEKRPSAIKIDKPQNIPAITVSTPEGIKKYTARSVGSVTVRAAFNQIDFAKNIKGPLGAAIRGIAHALEERVGHVPVHFIKDEEFEHIVKQHPYAQQKGTTSGLDAFYDPSAHQVIFPERQLRNPFFERNLIHETVHAATSRGLVFDDAQTAKIQKLLDHVKKVTQRPDRYGLTNTHEFLAEVVANPGFQKELREIQIPPELVKELGPIRGFLRSAWDVAINYIADGLGLKTDQHVMTALEGAIRLTQEAVDRPFSFEEKMQLAGWRQSLDFAPTAPKLPETRPVISSIDQFEKIRSFKRLFDRIMEQVPKDIAEKGGDRYVHNLIVNNPKAFEAVRKGLEKTGTHIDDLAKSIDPDDLKNYIDAYKKMTPEEFESFIDHQQDFAGLKNPPEMKSPPMAPFADTSKEPELPGMTRMEDRTAFKTPAAAGLTRDFYEKYKKLIAQQRTEDGKRRMELILKKAQETQTKEWKENFDRIYKEVEESIRQNPDFMADAALRRGRLVEPEENAPQTSHKRDRLNSDMLTEEQKAILDPSEHASGAMNPDDFAAALGFNSADGMLERLSALRQFLKDNNLKPDQLVKNIALEETERRMQAEHGDLGAKILEEARDAAMSESQYDLLHEETIALATSAKLEFSLTRQQVKDMVKKAFDDVPNGQISEAGYLRLAGKHGLAVEVALLDGDYIKAFQSKQAQYFAMEMARYAKALKKANDSLSRNFKRFAKRKVAGVDQEYTNVIHDIMFRTDSTPKPRRTVEDLLDAFNRSPHRIGTAEPLRNFVKHRTEAFRELAVPDWLQDPSFKVDDYKKLTAKQVMELNDAVRSLVKNGREEGQAELNGQKHDVLDVLQQMRDQVADLPTQAVKDRHNETRYTRWMKNYFWRHVNMESQADRLDRGKIKGLFKQFVTRPVAEGMNYKDALMKKYQKQLSEIGKIPDMDKAVENNLLIDSRTQKPYVLRKRNVMAILNIYGDLQARQKFLKGHDISEADLADFLRRNTKPEDWDRAKKIGEIFDDLFEQASQMQHRLSGVAPVKTPRGTFTDPHGQSRESWYNPIRYSRERPGESRNLMGRSAIEEEGYLRATVPTGYLEERTGYTAEFDLNLDMIPIRMRQMIHDIAMREPVIQASKFVYHPEFSRLVRRAIGDKAFEEWAPWLRDVANSPNFMSMAEKAGREGWEHLRQNTISVLIGLNPGTVGKHGLTALANSIIQTGGRSFVKQFATLIRELPTDRADWNMAKEKSEELQRRFRNFQEIVQGHGSELKLRGGEGTFDTIREVMMNIGAGPVAASDLLSSVPTWLVKYREAIARGETEGQAIYEGDLAVRQTHGSSVISNKPSIMREGGFAATFTSLYGFFSHMLQRQYEMAWRAKDARIDMKSGKYLQGAKQMKVLAGLMVGYVVLPALIEEAVSPRPNADKENWGEWALHTMEYGLTSSLIGVRDIGHAMSGGRSAQIGLIPAMTQTLEETVKDIAQLKMFSKNPAIAAKAWNHTIATIGLLTGLTYKSEGNLAEYLYRWGHGLEHPKGFGIGDLFSGIRHGTARKKR